MDASSLDHDTFRRTVFLGWEASVVTSMKDFQRRESPADRFRGS